MPVQAKKVLAVMTDLFFSAKIMDTAKKFGMTVEIVRDHDVALAKIREKPAVVVFDLNCDSADPIGLIQAMKADPETKRISPIGFVSHVQIDIKLKAQDAGCDMV